jgi:hypothetical protein
LFGSAVSLFGDRALVGAPADGDLGHLAGAAYLLERNAGGTWTKVAKLLAADGGPTQSFGRTVALFGDRAVVGAPQDDQEAFDAGAAYVFEREASGAWAQTAKLTRSSAQASDYLSLALSLSGDRAMLGAGYAAGAQQGAVFVYELGVGSTYCQSSANSTGAPAQLASIGSASLAADKLTLVAAPVLDAAGLFFLGPNRASIPFGNGVRCVGGSLLRLAPQLPQSGVMTRRLDLTAPPLAGNLIAGSVWNFQAWYRDIPAGGAYFNTSSALAILFEP